MRDWATWPTIGDYLAWARDKGCSVDVRTVPGGSGQSYRRIIIVSPEGRETVEIMSEDRELLMSTTIARIDRRLGMKSRFFT